jgi:uncharacterized protein YciI
MLYALVAYDKPNSVAFRTEIRPDHLKHLDSLGDQLVLAGPFADEQGNSVGSIVVIEAATLDDAKAAFGRDPFVLRGLFDSITIKPWKLGVNKTHK